MKLLNKIKVLLFFAIAISCSEKSENSNFKIDDDQMLIINGKRTFIIGSYHHPKVKNPFLELSSNGYNLVHVSPDKGILDSARKNNLMTWITTGIINEGSNSDSSRIINMVNKAKNHPSLLFWEIADEPAFNWNNPEPRIAPNKMFEAYSLIRRGDSKHPVFTNHGPVNLISTLQNYNVSTDIVGVDVYPVIPHGITPTYALYPDGLQGDLLNPYISQVGEYADKMKKVVNNSKPVFLVLQGFSWELLKPSGERDLSKILFPTYHESRFMAFNAIVHGANGILYWGTNYTPQPSSFIDDLNKVTREISEMQEILAAKTIKLNIHKEYHELMYSVDTGVEIIAKKVNGKTYLLTVNSDKNPVKLTFSGLSGRSHISVLSEARTLEIKEGKFTDSYTPFDVHLYKIE